MMYTIKLEEDELFTVIHSLRGTVGKIERQAAEQQLAAKNPKPEPTNESNTK